jgi:hypothetical protein
MMGKNIVLALLTSLLFVSCDGFFLGPAMNLNHDDPNRAFGRLECEPIDSDEIRVIWDWYDIERALRGISPVYDEIIIKHNTGSYPTSRLGGESYLLTSWDASTNPMSSTIFTDLKRDRDHYFALYAHEAGGSWMAPIYTSRYLEGYTPSNQDHWYVDFVSGDLTLAGINSNSPTLPTEDVSDTLFNIFYFDIWDIKGVENATLYFYVTNVAVDTTLVIRPTRARWLSGDSFTLAMGGASEFVIDRTVQAQISFAAGDPAGLYSVDVTKVLSKAFYHGSGGLFFSTTGNPLTLDYNSGNPYLNMDIVEYW